MNDTNLIIIMGQIPPTFRGTPPDLAEAMVRRMKIVSPTGANFIFIGDTEPTSNVGPWLKNGTQWWVFDVDLKRYVPLDISASEQQWFQTGTSTPLVADPPVWLRTTHDPTEADPSIGNPISWHVYNGTAWIPFSGIDLSGSTASRPSAPVEFQKYYDTTISVWIWWERNLWRTISGVPGDIKQVAYTVLTEALTANPGWSVFGGANQNVRGRWLVQATKDSGGTPETTLTTAAGVAPHAAFETFGEAEDIPDTPNDGGVFHPPGIALWTLQKD